MNEKSKWNLLWQMFIIFVGFYLPSSGFKFLRTLEQNASTIIFYFSLVLLITFYLTVPILNFSFNQMKKIKW